MEPLDLRSRPPRSCYEELDGLMLMPRTIDKLRGRIPGGDPGVYFVNGRILGISGYLLQRLGIAEEELLDTVRVARAEEDVAAWLRERCDVSQYAAINETMRRIKPKHAQDEAYFREIYAETLSLHPDLEYIVDIVDADDRRMFANVANSGRATLALIDHVQLAMPSGAEDRARAFYVGALGLEEVPKPADLAARGGVWFRSGSVRLHLGVDSDFRPAKKAHPAFRCGDYDGLLARLRGRDVEIVHDEGTFDGKAHCYVSDPFGNRIELIAS